MKIEFAPIGIIHSPFMEPEGMPIQPPGAAGVKGTVEVFENFHPGLKDLDGFSHIILLYHFHRSQGFNLHVVPFMDSEPRGLFATRAPKRPNPIGFSVVQLDKIEEGVLYIQAVDILDGVIDLLEETYTSLAGLGAEGAGHAGGHPATQLPLGMCTNAPWRESAGPTTPWRRGTGD